MHVLIYARTDGSWVAVGTFDTEQEALAERAAYPEVDTWLGVVPVVPTILDIPPVPEAEE